MASCIPTDILSDPNSSDTDDDFQEDASEPSPTVQVSTCNPWPGFVIVADNIDNNLRPCFQREDRQTRSCHYVNTYAVLDHIDMSTLSNVPPTGDLDIEMLLPSLEDHKIVYTEFEVMVNRYKYVCSIPCSCVIECV